MDEKNREGLHVPAVGASSLLTVFAVLCLTMFALLAASTVRADVRLADASAQAVEDYYAADCAAQEILARLRRGEEPEGVSFYGSGLLYAGYTCPISETQELQVEVCLKGLGDAEYAILRWQAVPSRTWESDGHIKVWDGSIQ